VFRNENPDPSLFPTGVLFSNNGDPKTDDFKFQNGGYYDALGLLGCIEPTTPDQPTGIDAVKTAAQTTQNAVIYNLQGQKVNKNYRGIIIRNGQKVVNY
jgi:hypothetical protein